MVACSSHVHGSIGFCKPVSCCVQGKKWGTCAFPIGSQKKNNVPKIWNTLSDWVAWGPNIAAVGLVGIWRCCVVRPKPCWYCCFIFFYFSTWKVLVTIYPKHYIGMLLGFFKQHYYIFFKAIGVENLASCLDRNTNNSIINTNFEVNVSWNIYFKTYFRYVSIGKLFGSEPKQLYK